MKSEETFYIDTQTSYSGKMRWVFKPLYDEPILQQEQVVRYFINGVVQNVETEWVDVPVERIKEFLDLNGTRSRVCQ